MKGLILDTTCEVLTLVIFKDNEVLGSHRESAGIHLASAIIPAIQKLLESTSTAHQELGAIFCATGPGSFTGLRIGLSVAKGLSEGWDLPLFGISSLEAMAWERQDFDGLVIPAIDARKQKFYCALWRGGQLVTEGDTGAHGINGILDISAQNLQSHLDPAQKVLFTGYHGELLLSTMKESSPLWTAEDLKDGWALGLAVMAQKAWIKQTPLLPESGPLYIRLSEAEETRAEKRGTL